MKIFFKISDTGGYPEGIIPHMIKAIFAVRFHLNYFYDANLLINVVNGPQPWRKSDEEKSK